MKTVDRIVYYIIIEDFSLDVDDKKTIERFERTERTKKDPTKSNRQYLIFSK